MSNFVENHTKVKGSTSDDISPDRGKVKIRLILKDRMEDLVFIEINVFYLPNSPFNFVNLSLLSNTGIYHYNEDQTLYDLKIQKTLAFAK